MPPAAATIPTRLSEVNGVFTPEPVARPAHAGRLAARWLNGYAPDASRAFQVMSYGAFAGTFTDYSGLDVGWWSREAAQKIVLAPPYPGNS